ncbi:MAG: glycoside hydrolase family 57 protein [Deltaproteobacteria bacterium]
MKLRICFLWHMHQPYYRDPETGAYILPWVRLHAIKDYAALPRIFRRHPGVRHTVNLVPSLLIQLRDYVENGAEDLFLSVSRKNALDLTRDDERFLLKNFFSAFAPTMILPQPRYAELYQRHEQALQSVEKRNGGSGGFGMSEYLDLVTLFNLTWFHPSFREEDPELSRLWRKGSGFTEREKEYVLDRQIRIMGQVFEEYRRLSSTDGGELSSSPMYHPILPLLIDNRSARDTGSDTKLPGLPFRYPEDARYQLDRGKEIFRKVFQYEPAGLWPSEGSISPATLDIATQAGYRWTATDEVLLSRAFGKKVQRDANGTPLDPEWFYRPYVASTPNGSIPVFFRDHRLSDLIGFEYSRWDAADAANNFIHNIKNIYGSLSTVTSHQGVSDFVVPVILDGENAWEYFPDSGVSFLDRLFQGLESLRPNIECVTFTEALQESGMMTELPSIPTGSWIDGTFHIWIGHPEDHAAWEMLSRARSLWETKAAAHRNLQEEIPTNLKHAYECLLAAEGSDWCWWYGDDHFTPHGPEFDRLFRHNIKASYREMGAITPDNVDIPIIKPERILIGKNRIEAPRSYIEPRIDGVVTSWFEWNSSSRVLPAPEFGAMHRAGHGLLDCFYYGFNDAVLFFRFDLNEVAIEIGHNMKFEIVFPGKGRKLTAKLDMKDENCDFVFKAINDHVGEIADETPTDPGSGAIRVAYRKVLEVAIPFDSVGCKGEDRIDFFLTLHTEGSFGERWPMFGAYSAELPGTDFTERMWEV